ncbi:Hypothetical protein I596_2447 [Dokdonella koreensis DS-123]|uniref:Uncharacterized protein n=1 Tax=Dokdonella koreensis DS-123 TaxID=1300342 RepID=A0A160DV98_9GAMM|nr:Hypothetical protein I596_2447 [Dokdonella koreensis DS-123]
MTGAMRGMAYPAMIGPSAPVSRRLRTGATPATHEAMRHP